MSTFYDEAAKTALSAIKEAGLPWTIARFTKTLEPITGAMSAVTATKGTVQAVKLPLNKSDVGRLDDNLVEALRGGKLRKFLVAATGMPFEPRGTDVLVLGDETWIVRGSTPLKPADLAILYTIIAEVGSISAADRVALTA